MANRTKIAIALLKILVSIFLALILYSIIDSLKPDGTKSFYCLSNDKCVTVWKWNYNEVYVILGDYKSDKTPSDDFAKITNLSYGYVSIILTEDNKLLVDVEDNAEITHKSSSESLQLYRDSKKANDILYTYFDGKYRRYKKEVEYISIDIKENFATDKRGKRLK